MRKIAFWMACCSLIRYIAKVRFPIRGDVKKNVVVLGGAHHKLRGGPKKIPLFCYCFHSIQKPPKRVKTQTTFFICVFCPYLGDVKGRLLSYFALQILLIILEGQLENFSILKSGNYKQKNSIKKCGSLTTTAWGVEWGSSTLWSASPKTTTFITNHSYCNFTNKLLCMFNKR